MPRKWRGKETRKTETTMGGQHEERPGKNGRGLENKNNRQRELEIVDTERNERKLRKETRKKKTNRLTETNDQPHH